MMIGTRLGVVMAMATTLLAPAAPAAQLDPYYVGAPTRVGTGSGWAGVSASQWYTCATRTDGSLWCWGANNDGEFGNGTNSSSLAPVQTGALTDWATVATGYWHTCGTRTDSSLWCWGRNLFGQLGDGTDVDSLVPVQVKQPVLGWATVSTARAHTCATRVDGSLWCWGLDEQGQLGDGTTRSSQVPVRAGADASWETVSAGGSHACAIRRDHSLWCWGSNGDGELGDGTHTARHTPTQVGSAKVWAAVSAGRWHTCAIQTDGSLWCWGRDEFGELGDGATARNRPDPMRVGAAVTWSSVAVGDWHTCATSRDGSLWCWGSGYGYGLGKANNRLVPTLISAPGWAAVGSGSWHTCGTRVDGSLWCWGANDQGQLGIS